MGTGPAESPPTATRLNTGHLVRDDDDEETRNFLSDEWRPPSPPRRPLTHSDQTPLPRENAEDFREPLAAFRRAAVFEADVSALYTEVLCEQRKLATDAWESFRRIKVERFRELAAVQAGIAIYRCAECPATFRSMPEKGMHCILRHLVPAGRAAIEREEAEDAFAPVTREMLLAFRRGVAAIASAPIRPATSTPTHKSRAREPDAVTASPEGGFRRRRRRTELTTISVDIWVRGTLVTTVKYNAPAGEPVVADDVYGHVFAATGLDVHLSHVDPSGASIAYRDPLQLITVNRLVATPVEEGSSFRSHDDDDDDNVTSQFSPPPSPSRRSSSPH